MRLPPRGWLPWLVALLLSSPAAAWNPETRVRMVDDAVRLMPHSLRLALERHRKPLLRGALEPLTDEDGPAHRPPSEDGTLDRSLSAAADRLLAAISEPGSFDDVARGFGELAHFVSDSGFPPTAGGASAAGRYRHFAEFCESRREKFPLVFYGHRDPELSRGDFGAFARRILEQARADDRQLALTYAKAGNPPADWAFDDRSVPFAIGSLAYSRSVTHIVRAWLAAWHKAGGDMGRLPYGSSRRATGPAQEADDEPARP